ncbi:MAG: conserved membrane protein of unknown function, partial [Rhodospirillaceae bacterium]
MIALPSFFLPGVGLTDVTFSPLLPGSLWALLGGVSLLAIVAARPLPWLRVLWVGTLLLALLDPTLIYEQRRPQNDVAVVVVDDSPSQDIGDRRRQTETALARLMEKLAAQPDLEIRVERLGTAVEDTQLFAAVRRAVADLPPRRLAGVVLITDGQVHDVPAGTVGLSGPLHALLTGHPHEGDRRLVIELAPGYGLVGQQVTVMVRVEDTGSLGVRDVGPVPLRETRLTIQSIPMPPHTLAIPVGLSHPVPVAIEHAGPHTVAMTVEPGPAELSLVNNRAVVTINGVRDRLKVLLISGKPHSGERTWRNILKSDANIDLVHFTILRPVEKDDYTPLTELALITFPIRELFEARLHDFDLIIFDRYGRYNLIPFDYLDNIRRFVIKGGAVLLAVGPEFGEITSLAETPLKEILPARPNGRLIAQGFTPALTDKGLRHPVTGALPSSSRWGRWLRQVGTEAGHGDVLMTGAGQLPLLILDRVGAGRVALLLSDSLWLWARGYEGGGPHAELLRRLVHWLMKEPALEEEALTAEARGNTLVVSSRRLHDEPDHAVVITMPDGAERSLALTGQAPGQAAGTLTVPEPGLYQVTNGRQNAVAAVGAINPPEWMDLQATDRLLAGPVRASGGGVFWLSGNSVPEVR